MLLFVFFTFKISFIKNKHETKTVLIPSISILPIVTAKDPLLVQFQAYSQQPHKIDPAIGILSWSARPDVLKLLLLCIRVLMKSVIFFSPCWCFLQTTQNVFSFSKSCNQLHFSFHFLFAWGFGRDLEL